MKVLYLLKSPIQRYQKMVVWVMRLLFLMHTILQRFLQDITIHNPASSDLHVNLATVFIQEVSDDSGEVIRF